MSKGKLTDKEERFIDEYMVDLNATQAYLRSHPGVEENSAATLGGRLLRKVEIQEKISARKAARSKRLEITADRVVRELGKVGFSNIADFIEWDVLNEMNHEGLPIRVNRVWLKKGIKKSKSAVVDSISETKHGIKIKLHDKVSALESLLAHLTHQNESAAKSQPVSFVDLIKRAHENKTKREKEKKK